ncbi:DUF2390 domain-containing protein [Marinobacter salinexigens]|uniref:DUF2390 domain-containing protein n=1 Tax=Marinobacter salinexigens TaxID=2919747 RepID=A0A5B0VEC9_9GAMM|nr:DUF2390 domain-containing protein [Marinobacter salinexigens]KAA1172371.1 DUF2390 domain-containing protein [Marinobacter salinexigens]
MDLPDPLEVDNPLWQFARTFWRSDDVQTACLSLQEQGWSVTRILCAGWMALNGRAYSGIEGATVPEWRDRVTGALRGARKALPKTHSGCCALRADIASLELAAEQLELALAWQTIVNRSPEHEIMQGFDELIDQNLKAAAPEHGYTQGNMPQLNTLASALALFPRGDSRP